MTTTELTTHVLDLEKRIAELEARTHPDRLTKTVAKGLMGELKRQRDLDPVRREAPIPPPRSAPSGQD